MSFEFYLLFRFFEIEVNQKSYSVFNKKRVREENIKDNVQKVADCALQKKIHLQKLF